MGMTRQLVRGSIMADAELKMASGELKRRSSLISARGANSMVSILRGMVAIWPFRKEGKFPKNIISFEFFMPADKPEPSFFSPTPSVLSLQGHQVHLLQSFFFSS